MPTSIEATNAWLADLVKTGAIDDESRKVLEAVVAKPEAAEFIGSSVLRQSDYSKHMNELDGKYKAELAKVQNYERELANWRGTTEKTVSQVQAELQQARAEAARIRQVATSYGLDEGDLGQPVAPHTTPPQFGGGDPNDRSTAFNAEKFGLDFLPRKEAEELGTMYTLLPAEINDIVAEHQELFGKSPRGMRQIVEKAIREQRPIRDVYEEEFKVADRRAELEAQAREAEITRRVEEKLTAWRSEHPEARQPRTADQHSPMFKEDLMTIPGAPETVPNSRSQGQEQAEAVNAAVAFWNQMDHE